MHTVYTQYAHIASVHTSPLPWLTGVVTPINCLSLSPGFQLYTPTETQTETFSAYPQYCGPSISLGPLRVLKSRHQSHGCVIEGPVDTEMLSSSASSSHQEQQFLLLAPAWNPSLMFLHGFLGQVHHDPPLAPPPRTVLWQCAHRQPMYVRGVPILGGLNEQGRKLMAKYGLILFLWERTWVGFLSTILLRRSHSVKFSDPCCWSTQNFITIYPPPPSCPDSLEW